MIKSAVTLFQLIHELSGNLAFIVGNWHSEKMTRQIAPLTVLNKSVARDSSALSVFVSRSPFYSLCPVKIRLSWVWSRSFWNQLADYRYLISLCTAFYKVTQKRVVDFNGMFEIASIYYSRYLLYLCHTKPTVNEQFFLQQYWIIIQYRNSGKGQAFYYNIPTYSTYIWRPKRKRCYIQIVAVKLTCAWLFFSDKNTGNMKWFWYWRICYFH